MAKETDKKAIFETMAPGKALAAMAVPTIISQLINLIYNMVDTFFIGRTGNSYMIAAATISFPIYMMTIAFSNMFGIGGGSEMARLIGVHRQDRSVKVCSFSFYCTIALGILYSLVVFLFLDPILFALGASENTILYARQYVLCVIVAGSIPTILSTVLAHLLRNVGYSKQASIGLSAGGLLNIGLDPLFMFVILPKGMEVLGAAVATLISNVFSCIYFLIVFSSLRKKAPIGFRLKDAFQVTRQEVKELFSVGIPSAILTGLFDVGNMVLDSQMSGHGDLQLAAIGIVMKVERFPNAINIGICQGMLPIVAYNFASGNHPRMKAVIKVTMRTGLIISFASVVIFEIFAKPFVSVFLSTSSGAAETATTLEFAEQFLRIRCLASPLQFLNYSSSYCMQGLGDGKDTLIHAVMRELVFYIPFMYILNSVFGLYGLVTALVAGELCGAVVGQSLLRRYLRKQTSAA
ncbi:MAG: MATE family efflux transporter [Oscillospiraceae bacterium]